MSKIRNLQNVLCLDQTVSGQKLKRKKNYQKSVKIKFKLAYVTRKTFSLH